MPVKIYPQFNCAHYIDESRQIDLKNLLTEIERHFSEYYPSSPDKKTTVVAHIASAQSNIFDKALGVCFDISIPRHARKLKISLSPISYQTDISGFNYAILLSSDIVSSAYKIDQISTIAHEIQHIYQHIFYRDAMLKCAVLHSFFT